MQISKYLFNLSSFYHFRITVGYSAIPDVDGMTGQTLLEEWVVLGVRATLDSEGVVVPSSTYQWCSCQVSETLSIFCCVARQRFDELSNLIVFMFSFLVHRYTYQKNSSLVELFMVSAPASNLSDIATMVSVQCIHLKTMNSRHIGMLLSITLISHFSVNIKKIIFV